MDAMWWIVNKSVEMHFELFKILFNFKNFIEFSSTWLGKPSCLSTYVSWLSIFP